MLYSRETVKKSFIAAAGLSIGLGSIDFFNRSNALWNALTQKYIYTLADALAFLHEFIGFGPFFNTAYQWLLGPGHPILVIFGAFLPLISFFAVTGLFLKRPLIDYLWPNPPEILDPRLIRPKLDLLNPLSAKTSFLARENEMRALMEFADIKANRASSYMVLYGYEGIGKTRLGLEWLKQLDEAGWDVGVLEPNITVADIEKAHLRRRTAILIDEPGRMQIFWPLLLALIAKKQCLRILLVDQVSMTPPLTLSASETQRLERAQFPPMRLPELDNASLHKIALEKGDNLNEQDLTTANGRPLFALLGQDQTYEISHRAAKREALANTPTERNILFLCALAGPIAHRDREKIPNTQAYPSDLERLCEGHDRAILKKLLPAMQPEILADEVLLHLANDMTEDDLRGFATGAINANPRAAERRLASLWQRALDADRRELLNALQSCFDQEQQERIKQIYAEADALLNKTTQALPLKADGTQDFTSLERWLDQLKTQTATRSFDAALQLRLAMGAVNAMLHHGKEKKSEQVETWGIRLKHLANAFPNHEEIQLCLAKGTVNAMLHYGKEKKFEQVETWGARLKHVADTFPKHEEIQLILAKGAVNSILDYGKEKKSEQVETWGTRLKHVADTFPNHEEIQLCLAMGAMNAMLHYGEEKKFEQVETWGTRLKHVADAFPNHQEIQQNLAKGAVNTLSHYGEEKKLEQVGTWGARLKHIADAFPSHEEIQLNLARGAVNAILDYGKEKKFEQVETWGTRLKHVADTFPNHQEIQLRLTMGAANAMLHYGEEKEFEQMETWGTRLKHVADAFPTYEEIQLQLAMGAYNAMLHYGEEKKFEQMETWGARFKHVADSFPTDEEIQLALAKGAYNAMIHYNNSGQHSTEPWRQWRDILAESAFNRPAHKEIQKLARNFGLTYSEQKMKSFLPGSR